MTKNVLTVKEYTGYREAQNEIVSTTLGKKLKEDLNINLYNKLIEEKKSY